ncbi:retinoic acid receptor responder protein 2-like isoform X2 [Rhinoderma darwinii]|uniref:retinoic acid receptor responder protein 2-like isoform X2 n=1 Tax=Rhinoderma darwinii TaxID=43563 RepID=UPI003F660DF1
MKTTLRRWWWISTFLVMAVMGDVPVDSLTDAGTEAVRLVREDFHKDKNIKNAFQVSSILTEVYEENSGGTFVKVKFTMKPTSCQKHKWMSEDCTPITTVKRTYDCIGCFQFNSSGNLLETGYQKCVRRIHAKTAEVRKERRKKCNKLKKKTRAVVGKYSFRR